MQAYLFSMMGPSMNILLGTIQKERDLTCTSPSGFSRRECKCCTMREWGISPSDKPALTAFPGSSKKHCCVLSCCPMVWIPRQLGGAPTSSPSGTSSKVQERDLCAITVRIRAQSHSVPAAWMDERCVDVDCVLVVALRGPSQGSSFIQVDPGTLAFVFSCL